MAAKADLALVNSLVLSYSGCAIIEIDNQCPEDTKGALARTADLESSE